MLNRKDPEQAFTIKEKQWPETNFPFTPETAPIVLKTKGKQIPEWTIDQYGLVVELQDSPVQSDQPTETVELIPMGAARLRISAFPVIGTGSNAYKWEKTPGNK